MFKYNAILHKGLEHGSWIQSPMSKRMTVCPLYVHQIDAYMRKVLLHDNFKYLFSFGFLS